MNYIDGILIPVKACNKEAYREMAAKSDARLLDFVAWLADRQVRRALDSERGGAKALNRQAP